jgi:hypothetical protein
MFHGYSNYKWPCSIAKCQITIDFAQNWKTWFWFLDQISEFSHTSNMLQEIKPFYWHRLYKITLPWLLIIFSRLCWWTIMFSLFFLVANFLFCVFLCVFKLVWKGLNLHCWLNLNFSLMFGHFLSILNPQKFPHRRGEPYHLEVIWHCSPTG